MVYRGDREADAFNGLYGKGTIFVNENAERPYLVTMGHESWHRIRDKHKDLHDKFTKLVREEDLGDFKAYLAELNAKRENAGLSELSQDDFIGRHEFMADFVGEQFGKKEFWSALAKKDPELGKGLAKIIRDIVEAIRGVLRKQKAIPASAFAELNGVQDALAGVYAEFARREKKVADQTITPVERPMTPEEKAQRAAEMPSQIEFDHIVKGLKTDERNAAAEVIGDETAPIRERLARLKQVLAEQRGQKPAGTVQKAETVTETAFRVKGEVIPSGAIHDASKIPERLYNDGSPDWKMEDGFLTSTGRFVSRKEAAEIAKTNTAGMTHDQILKNAPPEVVGKKQKPAKVSTAGTNVRTVRGAILALGGIKWGDQYKGERREMPRASQMLTRQKDGLSWDTLEQTLKDDGWLDADENLVDILMDENRLKSDRVTADFTEKKTGHLTAQEKKLKTELERDIEEPPPGDYQVMDAEDLPEGKKLTIIDDESTNGWDVYEVIEKDPFGITLKDGTTIELSPNDKVQVRKADLAASVKSKGFGPLFQEPKPAETEKPKLELKGERVMAKSVAALKTKKKAPTAKQMTLTTAFETAKDKEFGPGLRLEGEKASAKEAEAFKKGLLPSVKKTPVQGVLPGFKNKYLSEVLSGHTSPSAEGLDSQLTTKEFDALNTVMGYPGHGTKETRIERFMALTNIRTALKDYAATYDGAKALAENYKRKELYGMAGTAKVWKSGNKQQIAGALLGWRDRTRAKGLKTVIAAFEDSGRVAPKMFEDALRTKIGTIGAEDTAITSVHDYSSTQANLPQAQAQAIRDFAGKIPDAEIYSDPDDDSYGREEDPHVTIRNGMDTEDHGDVLPAFDNVGPIRAKMGKVSIFESEDYDVLKVDIDSQDLHDANARVGDTVDLPGETFSDYQPHVTIAYLQKGEGQKYVGDTSFEGTEIVFDEVMFSSKNGEMNPIALSGPQEDGKTAEYALKSLAELDRTEKTAFNRHIDNRPDGEAVKARIDNLKGTNWEKAAINSVLVRQTIADILQGKKVTYKSSISAPSAKTIKNMIIKQGEDGIWSYLQRNGILSHPGKPLNSITGSYSSCDPSKKCANICYAVLGRSFPITVSKAEIINYAIESDPARAAGRASLEYRAMAEFEAGKALRFFDKGDSGNENWLKFTQEINKKGVRAQIFSKHPEFLRKVSDKNIALLSIDSSNVELSDANPDLDIAFIYEGRQDLETLERLKDRIGVILPVVIAGGRVAKKDIAMLPEWAHEKTCPIDKGAKTIKNWNCTRCDVGTGLPGCFFGKSTKLIMDQITQPLTSQDLTDRISYLKTFSERMSDEDRKRFNEELDLLVSEIQSGFDRGSEDELLQSIPGFDQTEGQKAVRKGKSFLPSVKESKQRTVGEFIIKTEVRGGKGASSRNFWRIYDQDENRVSNKMFSSEFSAVAFAKRLSNLPSAKELRATIAQLPDLTDTQRKEANRILHEDEFSPAEKANLIKLIADGGDPLAIPSREKLLASLKAKVPIKTVTGFLSEAQMAKSRLDAVQEKLVKKGMRIDFEDPQVLNDVLALMDEDVSGWKEARTGGARMNTVRRAISFVKENPDVPASYVEIDLRNLGGINSAFGHSGANKVYRTQADHVRKALEGLEADVSLFRHGGDELSAVVVGAKAEDIDRAMLEAIVGIEQYASSTKTPTGKVLSDLPHPKHKGDVTFSGIGIVYGQTEIKGGAKAETVVSEADKRVESRKKAGAPTSEITDEDTTLQDAAQFSVKFKPPEQLSLPFGAKQPDVSEIKEAALSTRMVTTGSLSYAGNVVRDVTDAAALLAPIRKSAQELTYTIATDENGLVLEIHKYSKGVKSAASINPIELAGRLLSVEGVKTAYFAHNHPSGDPQPSPQDINMDGQLQGIAGLKDIDIVTLIIGGTSFYDMGTKQISKIRPTLRTMKLPAKERYLRKKAGYDKILDITNSQAMAHYMNKVHNNADGFLFLDTQLKPVGFLPLQPTTMKEGATAVIKAAEQLNATGMAFNSNKPIQTTTGRHDFLLNLSKALRHGLQLFEILENGQSFADTGKLQAYTGAPQGGLSGYKALKTDLPLHSVKSSPWYSQMRNALDSKLSGSGTPENYKQTIRNFAQKGEFKAEELEWSGLDDWLGQQKGKVTKQQVLDYLAENNVEILEVLKGGNFTPEQKSILEEYKSDRYEIIRKRDTGGQISVDSARRLLDEVDKKYMKEHGFTKEELEASYDIFGPEYSPTRHSQWQMPGGKNYRELLMTLPVRYTPADISQRKERIRNSKEV